MDGLTLGVVALVVVGFFVWAFWGAFRVPSEPDAAPKRPSDHGGGVAGRMLRADQDRIYQRHLEEQRAREAGEQAE